MIKLESTTSGEDHVLSASALPRYVSNLRMSQLNWDDLNAGREWRKTLRLCYLPKCLCEPHLLEALLEAKGLRGSVDRVRVTPGKTGRQLGSAVLRARITEAVPALVRLFHGHQFGSNGSTPVAVSFAEVQGARSSMRVPGHGNKLARGTEPARIKTCIEAGMSSDSTAAESARASSPDSDTPACSGSVSPRRRLPPGLQPPPGLESFCH